MHDDITGVILAGGKSLRMGMNKALIKTGDKTIIERTADIMNNIFSRTILITNTPDEYKFPGLEMFSDIYLNAGPIAGIHSGLYNSDTEKSFIISCDMPLMTQNVIEYITNFKTDKPITICRADGHLQKLAGIYSRKCLCVSKEITENIKNISAKCAVQELIDRCGAEIIDPFSINGINGDEFFNMNNPKDAEFIMKKYSLKNQAVS